MGTPGLGEGPHLPPFEDPKVLQEPLIPVLKPEAAQPDPVSSPGTSHGSSHAHPGAPAAPAGLGAPPRAGGGPTGWVWGALARGGRRMPASPSQGCAASPSVSSLEERIQEEDSIPKPLLEGCPHCLGGIWVSFSLPGVFLAVHLSVLGCVGMCFHPSLSSPGHFCL